jgi:hypothetical protein
MHEKSININTLCRDCVFAVFNEQLTKQEDCRFNRLERFIASGRAELVEDEETNLKYYKINTFCNRCRNSDWAKDYENPDERVIEQTITRLGYVLIANSDNNITLSTLKSLLSQNIKPTKIAVVFYNAYHNLINFREKIKGIEAKIDIVNVIDKDDMNHLLDHGYRRLLNTNYMVSVKAGFELPKSFSSKLDNLINEDLKQISLVTTEDYPNGLCIQTKLFNLLGGNFYEPLIDKIEKLAKEQNLGSMIIPYTEVIS